MTGGLARLASLGVEGVRVEPLAKDLGVTKGSFYWHFTDREELLSAVLEAWVDLTTEAVIARANSAADTPIERLEHLMRITTRGFESDLEFEVRAWARHDESVARMLGEVDRRRTGYARDLLIEQGFERVEAETRSFMLYSILLGNDLIAKGGSGRTGRKTILKRAIDLLLQREQKVEKGRMPKSVHQRNA